MLRQNLPCTSCTEMIEREFLEIARPKVVWNKEARVFVDKASKSLCCDTVTLMLVSQKRPKMFVDKASMSLVEFPQQLRNFQIIDVKFSLGNGRQEQLDSDEAQNQDQPVGCVDTGYAWLALCMPDSHLSEHLHQMINHGSKKCICLNPCTR